MQQEPDIVHHRLGLLGGGGHGDCHGKHRAGLLRWDQEAG